MAPKVKAKAPRAPKVPPPPDFSGTGALSPDLELSPDWLERYLTGYYQPEVSQIKQLQKIVEDAYARGDFQTAERLDSQLEEFYQRVDDQLTEVIDDSDPEKMDKGEEEFDRGEIAPSVSEQLRDAYARYQRGDYIGVDQTPEQALAARVRSIMAGEGFTPTGDDLRLTGDTYNPNGNADAARRVMDAPDQQLIDIAKDQFDSHAGIREKLKQGGGKSEQLIRFLKQYGPYAPLVMYGMQQQQAEAANPRPGMLNTPNYGPRRPIIVAGVPLTLSQFRDLSVPKPRPAPGNYVFSTDAMPIEDAIRIAANEGLMTTVEMGSGGTGTAWFSQGIEKSPHRATILANLQKLLQSYGIEKAVPLARGAESDVFDAGDKVFKIGSRFTYPENYKSPNIWGVAPIESARLEAPGVPAASNNLEVVIQPRRSTANVTNRDLNTLVQAINDQGFMWRDSGKRNMGFNTDLPYGPEVIDGPVLPYPDPMVYELTFGRPLEPEKFVPPKGNNERLARNLLIPALAAAGTMAAGGTSRAGEVQASTPGGQRAENDAIAAMSSLPGGRQAALDKISENNAAMLANARANLERTPEQTIRFFSNPDRSWAASPTPTEFYTGGDWSMDISPNETSQWYNKPELGYGGQAHQKFIDAVSEAMDTPAIPASAIAALGADSEATGAGAEPGGKFPGYNGGDMTVRQFMTMLPDIMSRQAIAKAFDEGRNQQIAKLSTPSKGESDSDRASREAALKQLTDERRKDAEAAFELTLMAKEYAQDPGADGLIYQDTLPTQRPDKPFIHPILADVHAELTGQRYNRNTPYGQMGADIVRQVLQSGLQGSPLAEDNTISQSEYDELKGKYGDEADRMMPGGAGRNAQRQRVFELMSYLSSDPRFAPKNYTSLDIPLASAASTRMPEDTISEGGLTDRFQHLNDPSSYRGRMSMATEAWDAGKAQDPSKPYVLNPSALQRWDPQSFMGLREQLGSPVFGGQGQADWYGTFGNPGTQMVVDDGQLPGTDKFMRDVYANQMRPVQIRPDDVSPAEARETSDWWQKMQQSKGDFWSPRLGPVISKAQNAMAGAMGNRQAPVTYLSPVGSGVASTLSDITESKYQTIGTLGGGLGIGAARGGSIIPALRAAGASLADEVVETPFWMTAMAPQQAGGLFTGQTSSDWLRTWANRDADPNNDEERKAALEEADRQWGEQSGREFRKWRKQNPAAAQRFDGPWVQ